MLLLLLRLKLSKDAVGITPVEVVGGCCYILGLLTSSSEGHIYPSATPFTPGCRDGKN